MGCQPDLSSDGFSSPEEGTSLPISNNSDYPNLSENWGFINPKGELVISGAFDETRGFSEGLALVRNGDKWGYIDKKGKVVIPSKFKSAWSFENGKARVMEFSNKLGIICLLYTSDAADE